MHDMVSPLKRPPMSADMNTYVIMIEMVRSTGHKLMAIIAATIAPIAYSDLKNSECLNLYTILPIVAQLMLLLSLQAYM